MIKHVTGFAIGFFLVFLTLSAGSQAAVWTNEENTSAEGGLSHPVYITFERCARIVTITTMHLGNDSIPSELTITGSDSDYSGSFPETTSERINDSVTFRMFKPTKRGYREDDPLILQPGTYQFHDSNTGSWIATRDGNQGTIRIQYDDGVCTSASYHQAANTSPFYAPGDILGGIDTWGYSGVMIFEVNRDDQSYSLINVNQVEFMLNPDTMDGAVGMLAWVPDDTDPFRMSWNRTERTYIGLIDQQKGPAESKYGPSRMIPEVLLERYGDYEYPPTLR